MTSRLYTFRRCPYAMRARMALAVAGLDPEVREVDLKERPAALRAISPKATVPVLQLEDGAVLDESLDIMRWALAQNDPEGWLPATDDRPITQLLIEHNDGPFKRDLDRFKYATRFPGEDPTAARDRAIALLGELEQLLAGRPFLLGNRQLADVALFPFVRQFAGADAGWFDSTPLPRVREWLARCQELPPFPAIMRKLPPWAPGDPAVRFQSVFTHDEKKSQEEPRC